MLFLIWDLARYRLKCTRRSIWDSDEEFIVKISLEKYYLGEVKGVRIVQEVREKEDSP